MKNVVKFLIISLVFAGFMFYGNINKVYASDEGIIETETVCIDNLFINEYTSLTYFNNSYYINYVNKTIYNNEINTSVENWNVFELVNIEESESNISLTFEEQDLGSNGSVAMYIIDKCSRKIILNSFYFNDLTYDEKVMVISHELGHALGLVDLDPDLGYHSIMNSQFESDNQITLIDALILLNILNHEENNFGSEYYFDFMNLCFADADVDESNGVVCPGPSGGWGPSSISDGDLALVVDISVYTQFGTFGLAVIFNFSDEYTEFYPHYGLSTSLFSVDIGLLINYDNPGDYKGGFASLSIVTPYYFGGGYAWSTDVINNYNFYVQEGSSAVFFNISTLGISFSYSHYFYSENFPLVIYW
jgi:hypothetical protein